MGLLAAAMMFGATSAQAAPTTLTETPGTVTTGGTVTVNWSGVANPTNTDWIGLYKPGAANTAYTDWLYDDSCSTVAGSTTKASGSCSFKITQPAGTYELRLLASDGFTVLATSGQITVNPVSSSATLTASPTTVGVGGSVTASWSGVSSPTTTDWIGVYVPGAANTAFGNWLYDNNCTQTAGTSTLASGSCSIKMPSVAGTYELRLLASDGFTVLAISSPITTSTPTLTETPTSVSAGGSVTLSWSGVGSPSTTDWIGLYAPGAANAAFQDWLYDSSCTKTPGSSAKGSGSCTFTAPATAGAYEFRLLANDGYTTLATSGQLTVTASGGQSPQNTAPPVISGSTTVGSTLTTTNGSWTNSPTSYTYQWQRCNTSGSSCQNVSGATNSLRARLGRCRLDDPRRW